MQRYFDSHCHLQKIADIDSVLNSARAVGVCGFVCNATSPSDWNSVVELTEKYSDIYGCIGVHPWYIDNLPHDWSDVFSSLLESHPRLMVGEIGLDKNHDDIETQKKIFETQLAIAKNLHRTIHVHCVGAWDSMLHELKAFKGNVVLHGFYASLDVLRQFMNKDNIYYSYSAPLLDERRSKFKDIIVNTPVEKILVESDDATPNVVTEIVEKISKLKSVDNDKIADTIYNNSLRLFGHGQIS